MKKGEIMERAIQTLTIAILALANPNAFAAGNQLQVNPAMNTRPGAPAGTVSRTGSDEITVKIINSCFGTNLRSVSNPLSPTSIIEARIPLQVVTSGSEPVTYDIWVKYPADLVTRRGMVAQPDGTVDPSVFGGVNGMSAALYGNAVQLKFKGRVVNIKNDSDGTPHTEVLSTVYLNTPSFIQHITSCDGPPVYGNYGYSSYTPTYPCGSYMGQEGPLSASLQGVNIAGDSSSVEISVAFPGQTGFCGGYYSPLMLFFDDSRPKFSGQSEFQLSMAGKTFWVEAQSPGFFLVYDKNENKKVDGKEELFGDQDGNKNGFEELKALDSNHDGLISSKDKAWKKLYLWNDKNGDGISQPEELEPIHKRVNKISLKYKGVQRAYGNTAQARQVGEFWFKDEKGKNKKGEVEDIWFLPITGVEKKK